MTNRHRRLACLALCLAATPAPATEFRGEYSLAFLGFTVARAKFDTRVEGVNYAVGGSVTSAGLAALFDDTRGTVSAAGSFAGGRPVPDRFRADYVSGKKSKLVDIRFAAGKVSRTTIVPEPKPRGADWLPLGPDDLRNAADPISVMLVRAGSPGEVCGHVGKLYDGEIRADLVLSAAGRTKVAVPGYKGEAVTCRMRFVPVSGYRKGRRAFEFLRTKSRIVVTFAPLGRTGVYAPVHATVGTEIGTITVRARRFEAVE